MDNELLNNQIDYELYEELIKMNDEEREEWMRNEIYRIRKELENLSREMRKGIENILIQNYLSKK